MGDGAHVQTSSLEQGASQTKKFGLISLIKECLWKIWCKKTQIQNECIHQQRQQLVNKDKC